MFHPIHSDIPSPLQFTYPHCYTPHPLCLLAADEVKAYLALHAEWQEEISRGKMFGVLVCEEQKEGEEGKESIESVEGKEGKEGTVPRRGFLAAFSGTLDRKTQHAFFVPPVFDLMAPGSYFKQEEAAISLLNAQIAKADSPLLREERKARSIALQRWLFSQYHFLNANGESSDIEALFGGTPPPSGTGDCCAPKLLQYAFRMKLKPLCMAEFWLGASPKDEIRMAGNFYPACSAKCKPILRHMLKGLPVEPNPLLKTITEKLAIVYEDEDLVVVNKPSGMLAVPGKDDLPSVQEEIRQLYPHAEGPLIVHRLDMDTSGLMVLALNNDSYHHLQNQFLHHQVQKRYVALAEGVLPKEQTGRIDLPLCPDITDRPRQMVSYEYGKRSITEYKVVGSQDGCSLLHLWPHTGRTHQLRVHLAHHLGLGCPIVGDRLYGKEGKRLMLHAEELSFTHPRTGEAMNFCVPSKDFPSIQ